MTTPKLGQSTCECGACHRYFTTTANFDKHRAGEYGGGQYCNDPADVGLVQRANGAWGGPPMSEAQKQARGWVA